MLTTNKNDKLVELMQSLNQEQTSVKNGFDTKLMEMYKFVKQLENTKGVQARIPYLYWID